MNIQKRPTMLMILDGFGLNPRREGNAVAAANTPNLDGIFAKYHHTQLSACGLAVGSSRRSDGKFRSGTPEYRRRQSGLSGAYPNHKGRGRRQSF